MPSGFQTFQSGVAGVAPVTMYQPPDVNEVMMSAVQDIMNRKERARQFDLQLQKLDQQDRLKQEQFGLEYRLKQQQFGIEQQRLRQQDEIQNRRLDQQLTLEGKQIENYASEINLRQKQADYIENVKMEEGKNKITAQSEVGNYVKRLNEIPQDKMGTNEAANQKALIDTEFAEKGIFEPKIGGATVSNRWDIKHKIAADNLSKTNVTLNTRLYKSMQAKGLDTDTLDYLQTDDKGNYQKNQIWNTNPDGSVFVTLKPVIAGDPTKGYSVVPPSDYVGKITPSGQSGWRTVTLTKAEAQMYKSMKTKVDDFSAGNSAPPIDSIHNAISQSQAQTGDLTLIIDPDGKTQHLIPRANVQKALKRGFTLPPQ